MPKDPKIISAADRQLLLPRTWTLRVFGHDRRKAYISACSAQRPQNAPLS